MKASITQLFLLLLVLTAGCNSPIEEVEMPAPEANAKVVPAPLGENSHEMIPNCSPKLLFPLADLGGVQKDGQNRRFGTLKVWNSTSKLMVELNLRSNWQVVELSYTTSVDANWPSCAADLDEQNWPTNQNIVFPHPRPVYRFTTPLPPTNTGEIKLALRAKLRKVTMFNQNAGTAEVVAVQFAEFHSGYVSLQWDHALCCTQ